jgi:hypothetical protein
MICETIQDKPALSWLAARLLWPWRQDAGRAGEVARMQLEIAWRGLNILMAVL